MTRVGAGIACFVVGAIVAAGCGSSGDGSEFGSSGSSGSTGAGASGSGGFGPGPGNDGGGPAGPCVGLECNQVACNGGATTSLTGKVFDPSGTVPLYNAVVYVPNADLDPFPQGVTCDRCGTAPSGRPIATALTNAKGEFKLDNVPVGVDFPLVVQIGRWRRKVTIPAANVAQCEARAVDAALTRLPRSKAEGDIPKIAITTGGADSLECFLRKLGLEAGEFSNPGGAGSVHLFKGVGGSGVDPSTPTGQSLWDDGAKLKTYDIVILSCEGSEYLNGSGGQNVKSAAARQNLRGYLDAGGRVFSSHYHYTWFKQADSGLSTTANWVNNTNGGNGNVSVDITFAKGQAFRDWLVEVGASTTPGVVPMTELRRNVREVPATGAPAETSRRWLYFNEVGADHTKFFSFNTPLGKPADQQCGRGVYTDIHVSSGDTSGGTFPSNCTTTGYTPQEKALLFLFFDLASCIQDESKPPQPPPPAVK